MALEEEEGGMDEVKLYSLEESLAECEDQLGHLASHSVEEALLLVQNE